MATALEAFPPRKRKQHVDETWTDGKAWSLFRGVDFNCSMSAFDVAARRHAKRQGKRVRVRIVCEDEIVIQFYGGTE